MASTVTRAVPVLSASAGVPSATGAAAGPRRRRFYRTAVACGLGVIALAAGLTWGWRHGLGLAKAAPTGWSIVLPQAREFSQAANFAGRYLSGETLFLPPSAEFTIAPDPACVAGVFTAVRTDWASHGGRLSAVAQAGLQRGRAPWRSGVYRLEWRDEHRDTAAFLNVLVLVKADVKSFRDGTAVSVRGRNLGEYPEAGKSGVERVARQAARYQAPEFFVVLDQRTLDLPIVEGLALGQLVAFIDKRGPDGRKIYTTERHTDVLPPSRPLCEKLRLLRRRLRAQGSAVTRFWITSGFRTPDYNRLIGGASFSRHCYGDAVDLVIDEDEDRRMDDLNDDGRMDRNDGLVIGRALEKLEAEGLVVPGGIGIYEWDAEDSVRCHVHFDCRGSRARWGQIARGKQRLAFEWWSKRLPAETAPPE